MIADKFDGCLVCEDFDLETTLSEFKVDRITPEYIEKSILKYLYIKNKLEFNEDDGLNVLLEGIPSNILSKIVDDVRRMFFVNHSISYGCYYQSYLFYYLEANLFKVWKPLLDLHVNNLLKKHIVLLDIGTGPGSIPIGVIEFYKILAKKNPEMNFRIEIDVIEAEAEFLRIADYMISEANKNSVPNLEIMCRKKINCVLDKSFDFQSIGNYDLITMSNFMTMNEKDNIQHAMDLLSELSKVIRENGAIIIIEPGDLDNGHLMKATRNQVVSHTNLTVYAPCSGVWENKDNYTCNCYSPARAYWSIPRLHMFLKEHGLQKAGRDKVPFQYIIYRRDGITKYTVVNNQQHYVKLKDLKNYEDKIVNVKSNIRSVIDRVDKNEWSILLCDGSCSFENSRFEIKAVMNKDFLEKMGISCHIIVGERITLKKVQVRNSYNGYELVISSNSKIDIEY